MTLPQSILALLFVILLGNPGSVQAQCKINHQVKVEDSGSNSGGKIFLEVKDSSSALSLKLFKIGSENILLVSEKKVSRSSLVLDKPIFTDLQPGTYFIQASAGSCTITIGGINGLEINKSRN